MFIFFWCNVLDLEYKLLLARWVYQVYILDIRVLFVSISFYSQIVSKQAWTSSKRAINLIVFSHILFKYLHQWGTKSVYSYSHSSKEMRICAKTWSRTIDLCCFFHFFICYLEEKWEHIYHWKCVKGMQFCLACI